MENLDDINLGTTPSNLKEFESSEGSGPKWRKGQHILNSAICKQKTHSFSKLCDKCKHMFDEWFRVIDAFDRGDSFADFSHWENVLLFEDAAAKNCHLCHLFLSEFKEAEITEARQALKNDKSDALQVVVLDDGNRSRRGDSGSWSLTLSLPLMDGATTAVMAMSPAFVTDSPQELPSSIWSDASISLAKWWLKRCQDSHHESCARPSKSLNPTRLIALSGSPRLIFTKDLPGLVKYTTLSHCWGSLKILRLLRNNISQLQQEIPWDELCKTFQDACIITKSLGFKYLWIDSLCIIQDDAKDWERESLLMSTVYGYSSLNIAAASAVDGSVGCFRSRNSKSIEKIQLCLNESITQLEEGQPSTGQAIASKTTPSSSDDQCEGTLYDCAPQALHKDCISNSPLGQRAWVLQERVLARRTLHFASQLLWECKGSVACETFPSYLPGLFMWTNQDLNTTDHSEHWFALIWLYSRCKLTFGKDKLIAISGIAQSMQKRYGDQYLAGLWRRDLFRQLLWRVVDEHERSTTYRAPSWSWASIDGGVFFWTSSNKRPLIKILDAQIEPVGNSIFGDIREGTLTLQCGHLVPFTITTYKTFRRLKHIINSGGRSFKCNTSISFDCSDADISAEYHLLSIMGTFCASGFVLEATQREQGQYRRVGIFETFPQNEEERKVFGELQNAKECLAPESAYVSSVPDHDSEDRQFVIRIV